MSASSLPPVPPSASPRLAEAESPVFQRTGALPGRLRQTPSRWSLALSLGGAMILGVVAFGALSGGRQARAGAQEAGVKDTAAPIDPASPSRVRQMAAQGAYAGPPLSAAPAMATASPADADSRRQHAPLMVLDLAASAPPPATTRTAGATTHAAEEIGGTADERFAARASSHGAVTAHAERLHDLALVAPQGTVIPAVLETAINSDLPGSARAVVSRDVRGFDGSQVLIPRGSTLIGQYRSGVAYGQHRALVIWSRILTPEGVSIDIDSPGTDPLGRSGLAGETDSHFLQRFGGSILYSVLQAGVAAASQGNASTAIVIGAPLQAQSPAAAMPQKTDMPVTVKVMQGAPMSVFLTRDLDFSGVVQAAR